MGASVHEEGVGDARGPCLSSASAACGLFPSPSPSSSASSSEGASWLLVLPTDCVMRVLSLLSTLDVCRLASVCRELRALVDSDEIWLSRLPSHPPIDPPSISKKDLYFRIHALPYWLDLGTGEGCFVKSARDLRISWGEDPRYWQWEQQPDSWFTESACLRHVCWFEVRGDFESYFLPGAYTVSFRIRLTDALRGWEESPVKLSLSTSNGHYIESHRFFDGNRTPMASIVAPLRSIGLSSWMELDAGEFHVEREMHIKLHFGMVEIDNGRWKKGVIVDCVKIQLTIALSKDL